MAFLSIGCSHANQEKGVIYHSSTSTQVSNTFHKLIDDHTVQFPERQYSLLLISWHEGQRH